MNPYRAIRRSIAHWRMSVAEKEHFAIDRVYGNMLSDYHWAAREGFSREYLADLLTGLAGCELAMSRTNRAMGWNPDPTPEEPEHAESVRQSGLLVQEIAYCAAEGRQYRGVRCRELETEPAAEAFRVLALAYSREFGAPASTGPLGHFQRWDDNADLTVGRCLSDLLHALRGVLGSQAIEVLVPLMIAHRYSPYACTCPRCAGPNGDHAGLPAEELKRRAEVTRGCDQP